jgi:hypothetical protein
MNGGKPRGDTQTTLDAPALLMRPSALLILRAVNLSAPNS